MPQLILLLASPSRVPTIACDAAVVLVFIQHSTVKSPLVIVVAAVNGVVK